MGRPAAGVRSASSSSTSSSASSAASNSRLHQYFLRSTTTSAGSPLSGDLHASRAEQDQQQTCAAPEGRTLRKKASIWSMFSRGGRKTNEPSISAPIMSEAGASMFSQKSVPLTIDVPSPTQVTITANDRASPSPRFNNVMSLGAMLAAGTEESMGATSPPNRLPSLRAQRSMQTLRSQCSTPTLRSAKSQFGLRQPSKRWLDTDSILSDDSDEVSVSWITSTGLRRAGLDLEDETMHELGH